MSDHENPRAAALRHFAERIGFTGDMAVLREATTHKSWANEAGKPLAHNERLEFLGDAVLELVVSDGLMRAHPTRREGELSRLRASIVNARSLAEMARRIDLGPTLRLGKGEERTHGREKSSVLADAYEAVIGAIYLEHGLEFARTFIEGHFGDRITADQTSVAHRDFKTRLQEHAQSLHQCSPEYRIVREEGPDHAKTFYVEVRVMGDLWGTGEGRSKKQAERAAARQALDGAKDRS